MSAPPGFFDNKLALFCLRASKDRYHRFLVGARVLFGPLDSQAWPYRLQEQVDTLFMCVRRSWGTEPPVGWAIHPCNHERVVPQQGNAALSGVITDTSFIPQHPEYL